MSKLKGIKIGYALTGSFCTFEKSFKQAMILRDMQALWEFPGATDFSP